MIVKKVIVCLILLLSVFQSAAQIASAQVFEPVILPPPPKSIPNYGTPNSQAIHGNWNVESILNAMIAAYAASNPNVDLNASFVVNDIVGNIATAYTYGPTQNGFYLNSLVFESELAKGVTIFGQARLQDDFNKFGDFNVRDGHLKYDFQYEKLINRQVAPAMYPNAASVDFNVHLGWPNNPGFPLVALDNFLFTTAGYNPDAFFFPRISDYLVNSLHYTFDNGFGFIASNRLRSMSGVFPESLTYFIQGPIGRNNNLSDTALGVDYTSSSNLQFYGATTFQNWNNKEHDALDSAVGASLPGFLAPGGGPDVFLPGLVSDPSNGITKQPCFPNVPGGVCLGFANTPFQQFKIEDTSWSTDQAGLNVPISNSASFAATWKKWNKSSAGTFGSDLFDDVSPIVGTGVPLLPAVLIENGPNAGEGLAPTGLQPQYVIRQYRGTLNWFVTNNSAAFLDFGHWEETPNASVLHETNRARNNAFGFYRILLGNQSVSLFGGWEQETIDRTVDYREIRIWDAFNPLLSNNFSPSLGTAVWNGNTVSFTPNPGVSVAPFTTVTPPPCSVVGTFGCGVNLITYPVGGIENIPGIGSIPVVAPLGRQSFTSNNYLAKLRVGGRITNNLEYNFTIERQIADKAFFRTDPQDDWKNHYEMSWTPNAEVALNASLDTEDNKSKSSEWFYPFSYHDNTFNLMANYAVASNFSMYADYRNYTEKINFTSPVMNTGTSNFIGPPNFIGGVPVPTQGSGVDIGEFFGPFAQYLAQPLNGIGENVADQDQEISVGGNFVLSKTWNLNVGYTHSKPQSYQNLFLTNPVTLSSVFGPFTPNTPSNFFQDLPLMKIMEAVDGRGNSYSLNLSHRLQSDANLGLVFQIYQFKNLTPRVTGESVVCGDGSPFNPPPCANGTPFGFNTFQYGQNLDNGQILSTSIYYSKSF